ncbi:MAG: hypothetical protein A2176_13815 [Spirochaetes bacterium RBG_13_51_14]|nr:MAG: hypothetical protein A2176_13815 [Spirochaetes bacterium RBG_13_51_14]
MALVVILMTLGMMLFVGVCAHDAATSEGNRTSLAGPWKIQVSDDERYAGADYDDSSWDTVRLPSSMMRYAENKAGSITGILWIRRTIYLDRVIPKQDIGLILGRIGNADETYFNGVKIGGTGSFPPHEFSMWNHPRYYEVPASLVRPGGKNVIAVRIWYYLFCEVLGTLALTDIKDWQDSRTFDNFLLIMVNYIIIAAGMPLFIIFFFFFIRRRSSPEYLFYCLQLAFGLVIILELCNYWNIYGNNLNRFKILGIGWAGLNVMHPIFLHRIYDLRRTLIEQALWLYLAAVVFMALVFTNITWLRVHGVLLILVTTGIGVYNLSCNFSALYKKRPYAKLFAFFGVTVVITAIHDGFVYLVKFLAIDVQWGFLFKYMLFPYGAAMLFIGTSLVLVSRFIGMTDEIEDLNTSLENFVIENALLNDQLKESQSHKKSPSVTITTKTEEKIIKVKQYIEQNYTSDLSREGLAASIDVHPDNLGKLFKSYTSQKLGDYIYELRVRDAAKKLTETDDTIINIAFSVGFESLRTFNRIFPKFMGTTPEKYRKMSKKAIVE